MAEAVPDPLDDLFHHCALLAFLEQSRSQGGWPDCDATRRLAFRLYEEALAARNAGRQTLPLPRPSPRGAA